MSFLKRDDRRVPYPSNAASLHSYAIIVGALALVVQSAAGQQGSPAANTSAASSAVRLLHSGLILASDAG